MIIRMKYNFYQIGHANRMLYYKEYLDTGSFAESKIQKNSSNSGSAESN